VTWWRHQSSVRKLELANDRDITSASCQPR
jgi:hypothetical protein